MKGYNAYVHDDQRSVFHYIFEYKYLHRFEVTAWSLLVFIRERRHEFISTFVINNNRINTSIYKDAN